MVVGPAWNAPCVVHGLWPYSTDFSSQNQFKTSWKIPPLFKKPPELLGFFSVLVSNEKQISSHLFSSRPLDFIQNTFLTQSFYIKALQTFYIDIYAREAFPKF
jgi:hypothetical protein